MSSTRRPPGRSGPSGVLPCMGSGQMAEPSPPCSGPSGCTWWLLSGLGRGQCSQGCDVYIKGRGQGPPTPPPPTDRQNVNRSQPGSSSPRLEVTRHRPASLRPSITKDSAPTCQTALRGKGLQEVLLGLRKGTDPAMAAAQFRGRRNIPTSQRRCPSSTSGHLCICSLPPPPPTGPLRAAATHMHARSSASASRTSLLPGRKFNIAKDPIFYL